jgi:hypothetical protein
MLPVYLEFEPPAPAVFDGLKRAKAEDSWPEVQTWLGLATSKVGFAMVTAGALLIACSGCARTAASPSTGGNLIVNGSFEEPQLPKGYKIFPAIPGWKVSFGPGVELQHGISGASKDGAQHAELDSTENAGIEQVISTRAGAPLSLSFAYSPRPGRPADTTGVEVRVDGKTLASLAEDGTPFGDTHWSGHVFAFTASGSSATIEFRGTGTSDGFGGYIDDVSVVEKE